MGFFDFLVSDEQKKKQVIFDLGLSAGVFKQCPVCRDVTESTINDDSKAKFEQALQDYMSNNDESYALFNRNEDEFRDKVFKVVKKVPFQCTCDKD